MSDAPFPDLEAIEHAAVAAEAEWQRYDWFNYERDFDNVTFGPAEDYKDNHEGPEAMYRLVAMMSPDVVLALVARIRQLESEPECGCCKGPLTCKAGSWGCG